MAIQSQVEATFPAPRSSVPIARQGVRPGAILAVLSGAAFVATLDLFIVNVAFDDIGRDFAGSSRSDLSWILNGYTILYAALLVPLGRLSDRFGRKQGFVLGLALFTAASAASALSTSLWMLVAFRGLQAVGAAALTPTSLGLLLAAMPAERRVKSVRIWATTGSLAAAAGPVVGGLLVSASWRWVFLVNIPVGILLLIAAIRVVPGSRDTTESKIPDLVGSVVLATGIGALALALVKGQKWGWASTPTVGAFAVTFLGIAVFWRRSQRHPSPVVEPALLEVPAFAWSNLTALLFSAAFAGNLLASILWMQEVWGYSALRTGLAVAPGPLMVPVFAAVGQRLARSVPVGRITALGCLLFGAGATMVLLGVGAKPHYASQLLPGWMVSGVGVGLALPMILSTATAHLPPARSATGSAVVNMSRQLGLVLGTSVLVALLGTSVRYADVHRGFQRGWWMVAIVAFLAVPAALRMTPRRAVVAG